MARAPRKGFSIKMEGDTLVLAEGLAAVTRAVAGMPARERGEVLRAAVQMFEGDEPDASGKGLRAIAFDPESPTAEYVARFARLMERQLDRNRHKGNREGWINDPPSALLKRLREEVDELAEALSPDDDGTKLNAKDVAAEAADVGNFAMMIADVVGGLK